MRLFGGLLALACTASLFMGCTARQHRLRADRAAYRLVGAAQREVFGQTTDFTIEQAAETLRRRIMIEQGLPHATAASLGSGDLEPPKNWPGDDYLERAEAEPEARAPEDLKLTMVDALQVAALNSREFQTEKERVFRAALELELQRDAFRTSLIGLLTGEWSTDRTGAGQVTGVTTGVEGTALGGVTQRFLSGMALSLNMGLDVARLYSPAHLGSKAVFADGSITMPLLRGRGRHIVGEPLTQAQRNLLYALYGFERFKHEFAVSIATEYLNVLQAGDQVDNAKENYRGLIASARRARRLADAGKLPEIQVDQAIQDELRARERWISARENFARRLDAFKMVLGLPPDAGVELDRAELERLVDSLKSIAEAEGMQRESGPIPPADAPIELRAPLEAAGGPMEIPAEEATRLALENRYDLRAAEGRVVDAERQVVVAADGLKAELTLFGSAAAGQRRTLGDVALDNSRRIELDRGVYSAALTLDLPFERTAEAIAYRASLIDLEQAVRDLQAAEDQTKLEVRNGLRDLLESREGVQIQAQAMTLAERRVKSTDLFLQAGRVEIRDLLEAQEALLTARNGLTAAMVNYRTAELGLQRDLGVLQVDERGLVVEFKPEERAHGASSNVQTLVE